MISFNVASFFFLFLSAVVADLDYIPLTIASATAGNAIAFSSDGNVLAVGDSSTNNVRVFTRSDDTWSLDNTYNGATGYGTSVALSGDGDVLAVGNPQDNGGAGSLSTLSRTGAAGFTQTITFPEACVGLGKGVSIAADGVAVAAICDNAVKYYWNAGIKFSAAMASGANDVSISSDGRTMAVGSPLDNAGVGSTSMFWIDESVPDMVLAGKYTGNDALGTSQMGYSVSVSADGKTFAFGAPGDNTVFDVQGHVEELGAVWVFHLNQTDMTWKQRTTKLIPPHSNFRDTEANNVQIGKSVSLSALGESLITSSSTDNDVGAAWVFARNGHDTYRWTQQAAKYPGATVAVAMSANGNEAACVGGGGAVTDNLRALSEVVYMRIKLKLWGMTMTEFPSGRSNNILYCLVYMCAAFSVNEGNVE